jgi:hypothetical protein
MPLCRGREATGTKVDPEDDGDTCETPNVVPQRPFQNAYITERKRQIDAH